MVLSRGRGRGSRSRERGSGGGGGSGRQSENENENNIDHYSDQGSMSSLESNRGNIREGTHTTNYNIVNLLNSVNANAALQSTESDPSSITNSTVGNIYRKSFTMNKIGEQKSNSTPASLRQGHGQVQNIPSYGNVPYTGTYIINIIFACACLFGHRTV